MSNSFLTNQRGEGLIELIVVLMIGLVLTVIAVTNLGKSKSIQTRQNIAREIKVTLERARFDAIKRRATTSSEFASVSFTSATSYTVKLDWNQNGTIDSGESRTVNINSLGQFNISGTNFTYPVTITFDRRGYVGTTNGSGTTISPTFYVCEGTCSASPTATNATSIIVSATGTVSMSIGAAPTVTATAPTVSNINTNLDINPLVKIQ